MLSWLILRGRCRSCGDRISSTYFLVELANGLFYAAIFIHLGPTIAFLPLAAVVSMTIVLIYIDLEIQILPDIIDLPGIAIGVGIGALRLGDLYPNLTLAVNLLDSLIGAAFGALLLLALGMIYKLLRKIEGMGLGDVKMLAMIGAVLGWRAVFPVLFLASVTGAAFGIAMAIRAGRNLQYPIPFGVFLGIATLAVLFFGPTLLAWYRALLPA
jgi:leader peptidase (prepilin peptidase)/N-methyltransferase